MFSGILLYAMLLDNIGSVKANIITNGKINQAPEKFYGYMNIPGESPLHWFFFSLQYNLGGDVNVDKLKILFVCTLNMMRSPTGEKIFKDNPHLDVKSAGVDKDAVTRVSIDLLEWADIIFVMEKKQRDIIHKRFNDIYRRKRIICLYIPDEYDYMDPLLIDIMKKKVNTNLAKLDINIIA
jgi:predicted protein tyrosine phosphatase